MNLIRIADKTGEPPEKLAIQWIHQAIRQPLTDPLESFIGAIQSNVPEWADHHDQYLGSESLKSE
ncbi:MAG: hypothetical protein HQM11_16235 [SAR324 cluster bacterium]|nr:hypothetical protein [SAR324 cluster bacterium]